jgi:hypothetical protein
MGNRLSGTGIDAVEGVAIGDVWCVFVNRTSSTYAIAETGIRSFDTKTSSHIGATQPFAAEQHVTNDRRPRTRWRDIARKTKLISAGIGSGDD